ncbi:MAG: YlbF family regulator [Lachnospiraceae bacterium]|nr:YlbF family regulator [Lachnospiraceae bacterium]
MSEIDQGLENFIACIKDSEIYREYRTQLELLKANPELKRQVDDYRKRNYELQKAEDMDFAKLDSFWQEYYDFRMDPLVDSFLAAELAFCRMMQEVSFKLTESLDFE